LTGLKPSKLNAGGNALIVITKLAAVDIPTEFSAVIE
jgi:hypothetical protein